jgi:type IV secretion system protein VirB1
VRSIRAQQRCRPDLPFRVFAAFCTIVAGGLLTQPVSSCAATVYRLSPTVFEGMAAQCEKSVAPETLLAVAKVESNFRVFAIHDNTTGRSYSPTSHDEAIEIAEDLTSKDHSVDLGIMQINNANLKAFGMRVSDAFEPCRAMAVAATILSLDYESVDDDVRQQRALREALSAYNTGNDTAGFRNGYVKRVEIAAREIVPSIETAAVLPGEHPAGALPTQPKSNDWDVWGELRPLTDGAERKRGASTVDPGQSGAIIFSDGGQS